jgi:hypothetical protein
MSDKGTYLCCLKQENFSVYSRVPHEHVDVQGLFTVIFLFQEEVWNSKTAKEEEKDDTVIEEPELCQDRYMCL